MVTPQVLHFLQACTDETVKLLHVNMPFPPFLGAGLRSIPSVRKMTWLKKFCIVLWKNYVIRKRHWILTLLEIVIPVLLFIIVVLIRSEIGPSDDTLHPVEYFDIWNEDMVILQTMTTLSDSALLLYAPQNNFTTKIMSVVSSQLKKDGK
jgi:hypothetical protein